MTKEEVQQVLGSPAGTEWVVTEVGVREHEVYGRSPSILSMEFSSLLWTNLEYLASWLPLASRPSGFRM